MALFIGILVLAIICFALREYIELIIIGLVLLILGILAYWPIIDACNSIEDAIHAFLLVFGVIAFVYYTEDAEQHRKYRESTKPES